MIREINETRTILAFTFTKDQATPYFLCTLIVLLSILGFLLKQLSVILIILYLLWNYRNEVTQETLHAIKGLGIQITNYKRNGEKSNLFIDCGDIREIIINEALSPYDIRVYIGIILIKSQELIIPFQKFNISLTQAKQVYREAREILFN